MQVRGNFHAASLTSSHVKALASKVASLANTYEKLNSAAWFSYRDKALTTLTNSEPPSENLAPKLAYYHLLNKLHHQLKLVRYPQKDAIIQLTALLKSELMAFQENNVMRDDDKLDVESALFSLFKQTHPERTRDDIDQAYLQSLVDDIQDAARHYRQPIQHTPSKIERSILDALKNISITQHQDKNIFAAYHQILLALHRAIENDSDHNLPLTQQLNELLIHELKSQREANWQPPTTTTSPRFSITRALNALEEHADFSSNQERALAVKWNLSASDLHDTTRLTSWQALCAQQGWHIEADHDKELTIAVRHLLGLESGSNRYLHQHCYALQTGDPQIKLLEKDIAELTKMLSLQDSVNALQIKLKKQSQKPHATNDDLAKITATLARQEAKLAEFSEDISDIKSALSQKEQELLQYKHQLILNEIPLLQQNIQQLKIWTTRNLTILFTDHIINGQITRLEQPHAIENLTLDFAKIVKRLTDAYYQLLLSLRETHELIQNELYRIQSFFKENRKTFLPPLSLPSFTLEPLDPQYEQKRFCDFILQHLAELTDARDFHAVKKLMRYDNPIYPGVVLPDRNAIKQSVSTINTDEPTKQRTERMRFIKQNHITITSLETPQREQRTLAYHLLLGIAVGIIFAMVAAGLMTALIFSGGLVAVPLTTLAVIGLVGGLSLGGVTASFMGGGVDPDQPDTHFLSTTARNTATLALHPAKASRLSVEKVVTTTDLTTPPSVALPDVQNQQMPPASTRSVSPH